MTNFKKILLGAASLMIVATVAIADGGVPADLEKGSVSGVQPTAQSVVVSLRSHVAAHRKTMAERIAAVAYSFPTVTAHTTVDGVPADLEERSVFGELPKAYSVVISFRNHVAADRKTMAERIAAVAYPVPTVTAHTAIAYPYKSVFSFLKSIVIREGATDIAAARAQSASVLARGHDAVSTQLSVIWHAIRAVRDQVKLVNASGQSSDDQYTARAAIDGFGASFSAITGLHIDDNAEGKAADMAGFRAKVEAAKQNIDGETLDRLLAHIAQLETAVANHLHNHDAKAKQIADLKTKIAAVKPHIDNEVYDHLLAYIAQLETAVTNNQQLVTEHLAQHATMPTADDYITAAKIFPCSGSRFNFDCNGEPLS
ncbi:MAG: hypothetical protein J0G29_05710 [Alphaproteobacteria bacterium]|nr:hypothetical protein [Alphaproteobacteria bacterium]